MADPKITAEDINNLDPVRALARIKFLNEKMSETDSDMFEYFALLEIEELEERLRENNPHTDT